MLASTEQVSSPFATWFNQCEEEGKYQPPAQFLASQQLPKQHQLQTSSASSGNNINSRYLITLRNKHRQARGQMEPTPNTSYSSRGAPKLRVLSPDLVSSNFMMTVQGTKATEQTLQPSVGKPEIMQINTLTEERRQKTAPGGKRMNSGTVELVGTTQ